MIRLVSITERPLPRVSPTPAGASRPDLAVLELLGSVGAEEAPEQFLVLESCHSTWLFDTTEHRFCRVLKGPRLDASVATEWRHYDRLVLHPNSDAFVVFLDASGTRLLRSWRHTARCEQCGGNVTAEMSLDDLRRVARA
jgi:hypothetical protein